MVPHAVLICCGADTVLPRPLSGDVTLPLTVLASPAAPACVPRSPHPSLDRAAFRS